MRLFKKIVDKNTALYWGLIITFGILYFFTAFISWYHSITFFNIANTVWLSVIFSLVAEIGQAGILFSILLTKNKQRFLAWITMFILTSLQIIGNVVASYKFIEMGSGENFVFFQKSILFWVQTTTPEMIKVIIAWIVGSILPIIALSMTGLVATNLQLKNEESETKSISEKRNTELDEKITKILKPTVEPVIKDEKEDDEFGPIDLTNVEPDILPSFKFTPPPPPDETFDENNPEDDKFVQSYSELDESEIPQLPKKNNTEINQENILDLPTLNKERKEEFQEEFQKELTEQLKQTKKRGRPPKQKDTVVESKKEQELLQKEDVQVPEKIKRFKNPLKLKDKKIKSLKNLDEFNKPSKGDEIIALIETLEKDKDKESITQQPISEEQSQESLLIPPELLAPYSNNGVEIIDAKAIPKKII